MRTVARRLLDAVHRGALWAESRAAGAQRSCRAARQPASRRPRLLILVDRRGWAFDQLAQQRRDYVSSHWDVEIAYLDERPQLDPSRYDLMFNPNWCSCDYDRLFYGRYIRGLFSHKWERGPYPYRALRSSLRGAVACFVPDQASVASIRAVYPAVMLVKEGIDPDTFHWMRDRTGDNLVVGWSGNIDNPLKRVETVVKPACQQAGVQLRIAHSLTRPQLNEFYNDVDLVLIASEPVFEGNPLALYEAGACGRTVLATSVGCVPEIVESGKNGFVVEATWDAATTVDAFVERLLWCRAHVDQVREMGKRLRQRVLAERTIDKTCETFRKAIEWVYAHRWA